MVFVKPEASLFFHVKSICVVAVSVAPCVLNASRCCCTQPCGKSVCALQEGGAVSSAAHEGVGTIKIRVAQCRTDSPPSAMTSEAIPLQKTFGQW